MNVFLNPSVLLRINSVKNLEGLERSKQRCERPPPDSSSLRSAEEQQFSFQAARSTV